MLNAKKLKKFGPYLGVFSTLSSSFTIAMQSGPIVSQFDNSLQIREGNLIIQAKENVKITGGQSATAKITQDIESITYEDFDVTANVSRLMTHHGSDFKKKVRTWHLDTKIPYIGGEASPSIDYGSLKGVPFFIATYLQDKIHPSKYTGAADFFEKTIVLNQQNLTADTQEIPDLDCLFYKPVNGSQHLFLRLSSNARKEAEVFNNRVAGKTLVAEDGNIKIDAENIGLDHVGMEANNISCEAKNLLLNRASQMKAKWAILLQADKQRHETVINKWIREERGKNHFSHIEGIESVDNCVFIAEKVIQAGNEVENVGVWVEATEFDDLATHTSNMPAKITLYNHAWQRNKGLFSSAQTSTERTDDFLTPSEYHVDYYRSISNEPGSSIKIGYTIIDAGSVIEIIKDTKEDVRIDETHTISIRQEKSGLSFCGGAKVPDPTAILKRMELAINSENMVGLSTAAISAVAKGIRIAKDYEAVKNLLNGDKKTLNSMLSPVAVLQTLARFFNGPSIQFGRRSVDINQKTTIAHGNEVRAPRQNYYIKDKGVFCGNYIGDSIDIKVGTMITLDLPQTIDSRMSMHQCGISMDLLSFGLALLSCGLGGALAAGVAASTISISCQDNKSHQTIHKPTTIQANNLNIEADNGYLTQAQIKAGIVHAVFTNDLVMKTLANEQWSVQKGGSFSFGLGFANFATLAEQLVQFAASTSMSSADSGNFEKIIDDFASMVGEDEFYLKVGNVLRTESAFLGQKNHDKTREHIEAKQRQEVEVEQHRESWDRSFELSVGDLMAITKEIKDYVCKDARKKGATQKKAEQISEEKSKEVAEKLKEINEGIKKLCRLSKEVEAEESSEEQSTPKDKLGGGRKFSDNVESTISSDLLFAELMNPAEYESSDVEQQMENLFKMHQFEAPEMSIQDYVDIFIPKNKVQEMAKMLVQLRYSIEDFISKHQDIIDSCRPVAGFLWNAYQILSAPKRAALYTGKKIVKDFVKDFVVEEFIERGSYWAAEKVVSDDEIMQEEVAKTFRLGAEMGRKGVHVYRNRKRYCKEIKSMYKDLKNFKFGPISMNKQSEATQIYSEVNDGNFDSISTAVNANFHPNPGVPHLTANVNKVTFPKNPVGAVPSKNNGNFDSISTTVNANFHYNPGVPHLTANVNKVTFPKNSVGAMPSQK